MTELNEIQLIPIGKNGRVRRAMWSACSICGARRWVSLRYNKPMYERCYKCRPHPQGIHNYHWRFDLPKGTIAEPIEGDVRNGPEIGKTRYRFIWQICKLCGGGHWTRLLDGKPAAMFCPACRFRAEKSPTWKGGRTIHGRYAYIYITKDDFFWPMALQRTADVAHGRGYIAEHRLVMAKHLGRILQSFEAVHHKNGIKTDNRIENLELTTHSTHISDHNKGYTDGYRKGFNDGRSAQIQKLESQNEELLKEIRLLQLQMKGALT